LIMTINGEPPELLGDADLLTRLLAAIMQRFNGYAAHASAHA